MNDELFEQLLGEIRHENAPMGSEALRDRVWQTLAAAGTSACDEVRTQFADYLAGGLTEGRRLLVDDHLSRCPECRRTMAELRGEVPNRVAVLTPSAAPARRWPVIQQKWM